LVLYTISPEKANEITKNGKTSSGLSNLHHLPQREEDTLSMFWEAYTLRMFYKSSTDFESLSELILRF